MLVAIVASFWLIISGSFVFGEIWDEGNWSFMTMIYLAMTITAYMFAREELDQQGSLGFLMWFGLTFLAGSILFPLVFRNVGLTLPFPVAGLLPVILMMWVVSFSEEVFFRSFLATRFGLIPSALIFGGFHFIAYQLNVLGGLSWLLLLQPFGFGLAVGYMYLKQRQMGIQGRLGAAVGLHLSFNLAVLGISFFLLGGL
jgi:membrane protease YdiL (CAAX protease family)